MGLTQWLRLAAHDPGIYLAAGVSAWLAVVEFGPDLLNRLLGERPE